MTNTLKQRVGLQLLILVIGLVAMLGMHEHLRDQQSSRITDQTRQASLYLNQSINLHMDSSVAAASAINENIARAMNNDNEQMFRLISKTFMQDYPYAYYLTVANADNSLSWSYPDKRQNQPVLTTRNIIFKQDLVKQSSSQQQSLRTLGMLADKLYYQVYSTPAVNNASLAILFSLTPVIEKLTSQMDNRLAFKILSPRGTVIWKYPRMESELYSMQTSRLAVNDNDWILQTGWLSNPSILATNLYMLNWGTGMTLITILLLTVHHSGSYADRLRRDVSAKTSALESANRHLLDVISERIQSEKKLEYSERRYRLLFNNANDAVFVQHILNGNQYSNFVEVNDVACNLLGYDHDTLRKHSMLDYTGQDIHHHRHPFASPLSHEPHQLFESVLTHADGHQIPVEISSHSFELMGQQTVLSIVRDITERKQAEKEVRQRQDELAHAARYASMGKLASGLAHEINQPLSAIVNYINGGLRRLETDNLDPDELKSVMKKIAEQAQRAASIISGMRDFIRKRKPRRGETEVNTLVRQTLQLVQSEIKYNSINVTQDLTGHPPMVVADAIQIEQVLMNLIKNAIEALMELPPEHERKLTLTTDTTDENEVRVSIEDNGPGLAPGITEHLFESFHTTKSQGMGLGLSICRTIIETHGGQLWADTKLETGARFCFTIPQYHEGPDYG